MMTSLNGYVFCVTGLLWGEFTGEFPSQRLVTRGFDVFFDLRLNKRLRKPSRRRWFETPTRSLWRHCKVLILLFCSQCVVPADLYGVTGSGGNFLDSSAYRKSSVVLLYILYDLETRCNVTQDYSYYASKIPGPAGSDVTLHDSLEQLLDHLTSHVGEEGEDDDHDDHEGHDHGESHEEEGHESHEEEGHESHEEEGHESHEEEGHESHEEEGHESHEEEGHESHEEEGHESHEEEGHEHEGHEEEEKVSKGGVTKLTIFFRKISTFFRSSEILLCR